MMTPTVDDCERWWESLTIRYSFLNFNFHRHLEHCGTSSEMTKGPKKTPVTPGEWNALGRYFFQKRMFDLAVGAFRVAVRARPDSLVFQENLGIALIEIGEFRRVTPSKKALTTDEM
jgi:hypothetical protein